MNKEKYFERIRNNEIKGPAFKHLQDDDTFTDYTFDEVIAATDYNSIEKIGWLAPRINGLKKQLTSTDYVVIKLAEGVATQSEYADVLAKRQQIRDTINTYQKALNELEALNEVIEDTIVKEFDEP